MNAEHDPLESELAAFRPRGPSLELNERIAARLATGNVPPQPRPLLHKGRGEHRRWFVALAAIGVAVAVAASSLLPRHDDRETVESAAGSQPALAYAFDDALPSAWQYRAAVNDSSNELEAALDKYARQLSEHHPEHARAYVFSQFDITHDPLGEL